MARAARVGAWEEIWRESGAHRLWSIPDAGVAALADRWRAGGARRVLDLGCGIGRHVHLFARAGFEVHGIDHSASGIEACRRRLETEGLTAELRCGDMGTLPYPDGHFDAIVAFNSIYHGDCGQVRGTIREMRRALGVGGVCFATMLSRQSRLYGKGPAIAPHTFASPGMFQEILGDGGERGVPHYFSSEEDVRSFFHGYTIEALEHGELQLAARGRRGGEPVWLRIPQSYFWRILATKIAS